MRLLEVVEGAEEASSDARHVLLCEVWVALGWGVSTRPQQRHEAGCHHVRAELGGGGARGGRSPAVQGGLPLLGAQRDLLQPPVREDLPGLLRPLGKAIHRPAKALVALWTESPVSRDLRSHVAQMWRHSGSSRPGLCRGGGVVGREEGVGVVYYPVASWCVIVGGGEGVVYVVHEGHVRGEGWLMVVGGWGRLPGRGP